MPCTAMNRPTLVSKLTVRLLISSSAMRSLFDLHRGIAIASSDSEQGFDAGIERDASTAERSEPLEIGPHQIDLLFGWELGEAFGAQVVDILAEKTLFGQVFCRQIIEPV